MSLQPLYRPDNCGVAYQLNWALTLFSHAPGRPSDDLIQQLRIVLEADGIRLLEQHTVAEDAQQLWLSTRPELAPTDIIRLAKGRWHYLVREQFPSLWRGNYHIGSVGETNNASLQAYVARQVSHHRLADPRATERLDQFQFFDETIDLTPMRASSHGRFVYNLHIVLETKDHLPDLRIDWLQISRDGIIKVAQHKGWWLSRIGIASNHCHILLGAKSTETPRDVVLSLMNNLAFAHGMKPVFAHSFYVGTFGSYDRNAIRRRL